MPQRSTGGSEEAEMEFNRVDSNSCNDNKAPVFFAGEEENNLTPPSPAEDMMIEFEETAERLIFSDEDDAFPSLADFPCLSSPSASPSLSSAASTHPIAVPYLSIKSPSTTSSETDAMQAPTDPLLPIDAGFDIIGEEIDLWKNYTEEPIESGWDSSASFFSGETATEEKVGFLCGGDDCASSEDLAKVFLDWLKRNKDSISPEDLRSIKLKRSTIECAARRLGGGKQGRVQLLKLILAWVQNHHLQKRRRRSCGSEEAITRDQQVLHNYPPLPQEASGSNTNIEFYYEAVPCNSWMPYAGPGESSYPPVMPPYHYYHDQFFSPEPWQQGLISPAVHYSPFGQMPAASQCLPVYYSGHMASATREARRKRMARQRRSSSLHHHRSQKQQQQQNQQQQSSSDAVVATEESSRSTSSHSIDVNKDNPCDWSFLSSLPADIRSPPPAVAEMQQENYLQRHASSAGDRLRDDVREGIREEKNYRFLLQKVLKQSDVGSLGRIVLPKKEAEINLPELDARDGISIEMEDIGTSRVWNMRYRFWPNNKSRMYLLENTGDFVRSNGLQEGDFIVIYSDVKCGKYMIRGVKVRPPVDAMKGAINRNSVKPHQKKEKSSSTMAASQLLDDKGKSPSARGN